MEERIQAIQNLLKQKIPYVEAILRRLKSLGYKTTESDDYTIAFCIGKVEEYIKNFCNISELPDGLYHTAVDMVCGEFMRDKLSTGGLNLDGGGTIIAGGKITEIKEGDTTVKFSSTSSSGGSSSTGTIEDLIDKLTQRDGDLMCYRKIKW